MPNPDRSTAQPSDKSDPTRTGPLWARAVHRFYDPIFDIRSGAAFQSALNEFVVLDPAERAFHETHLLYRLVQGVEGVYTVLRRIEGKLDATANADLSALEHLEPIRAALEELVSDRPSLVAVDGWEEDRDEEDEDGDDPLAEEEEADDDEDPDVIYDTVPHEAPAPTRTLRRPAAPPPAAPARAEPPPDPDPQREVLVGDLVPASEGPQHDATAER